MEYYERIKNLREDRDIKQIEVASYLGIKPQQLSRYELGTTMLPLNYLVKLSDFFGVSTDYILGIPKGRSYPK